MSTGRLKMVENIRKGDKVQSYSREDGWDNAHIRFNKVIDAEVLKITKREETHLVTTTFDNDTSLTLTLEYPYNMQHTSGSLCENPDTHGICEHAGWESYRPDITAEYYWDPDPWPSNDPRFNIPESSKYNSNIIFHQFCIRNEHWRRNGAKRKFFIIFE